MAVFHNYETVKLHVEHPEAVNIAFVLGFVAIAGFTLKKAPKTAWFDHRQTDSLKGMAILLIVLTHFWAHVAREKAHLLLAGDAVGLFLMLSGFGLTMSHIRTGDLRHFAPRRARRVMLPYWISTVVILTLDMILLNRTLPLKPTLLTFLGINLTSQVRRLDYVRWFITFLLFHYGLFYLVVRSNRKLQPKLLLLLPPVTFVFCLLVGFRAGYLFMFPMGCVLALLHEQIHRFITRHTVSVAIAACLGLVVVVMGRLLWFSTLSQRSPDTRFPEMAIDLINLAARNLSSVVFSLSAVAIFAVIGMAGFFSRFVRWCGSISYELFLLHGAFLVRYNPFFAAFPHRLAWIGFAPYFVFMLLLCHCFRRLYIRS